MRRGGGGKGGGISHFGTTNAYSFNGDPDHGRRLTWKTDADALKNIYITKSINSFLHKKKESEKEKSSNALSRKDRKLRTTCVLYCTYITFSPVYRRVLLTLL